MRSPGLVALALLLAAAPAHAHVTPSVDDNNRYLKLTPLGDRVRLSYTVLFGDVPGAALRPQIDANHDGTLSADEAGAFGAKIAAQVTDADELTIDGTATRLGWASVEVGITPPTAGGSFSIDLVAWVCLPTVRGHHELRLRDRLQLPHAGETELKVEDSPGVHVDRARVGTADDPDLDFRFAGPSGPLTTDGLDLVFTASERASTAADGVCATSADTAGARWPWVVGGGGIVAVAIGAVVAVRRRKR